MSELFELIVTGDWSTVGHWYFWFNLLLLLIFLFIWLYRMNMSLKKYDPLFIIPLLQSNYILFSTVTGGIYFQEFALMSDTDFPFFFSGIAIMFFGLALLAPTSSTQEEDQSKSGWMDTDKEFDTVDGVVVLDDPIPEGVDPAMHKESVRDSKRTEAKRADSKRTADSKRETPTSPNTLRPSKSKEMDATEAAVYFSDVLGPGLFPPGNLVSAPLHACCFYSRLSPEP